MPLRGCPLQVDLEKLEPRLLQMGCKIVDFGNAVWIHGHPLPEEVQTQHYRAPEVRSLCVLVSRHWRGGGVTCAHTLSSSPPLQVVVAGHGSWRTIPAFHHCLSQATFLPFLQVLLGAGYHDSADMWSLACMVFELVTGDFLFNPREQQDVSEEQNHMAQVRRGGGAAARLTFCVGSVGGWRSGSRLAQ